MIVNCPNCRRDIVLEPVGGPRDGHPVVYQPPVTDGHHVENLRVGGTDPQVIVSHCPIPTPNRWQASL